MAAYDPTRFVEPLGYQPVEFLDLPPMSEAATSGVRAGQPDSRFPKAQENRMTAEPLTISRPTAATGLDRSGSVRQHLARRIIE